MVTSRIECECEDGCEPFWYAWIHWKSHHNTQDTFFFETKLEHCLTQPTPIGSFHSFYALCLFLFALLPTFEFLCDGLLKRHSDKCGSMNRFSFTHTMHKTVRQLNRKIGIHKSDACMCKSIMVCVRELQIGLTSSVHFSKKLSLLRYNWMDLTWLSRQQIINVPKIKQFGMYF